MSQTMQERNKALVLEAFDALFNKRDYAAAERFWSPNYIQHSAHIAPGREGLFNLVKSMPPTLKYEPGAIVADGDVVIVHGRFSGFGAPVNWIAADILRIEDGVLVEHWDVIQDDPRAIQEPQADVRRLLSALSAKQMRSVLMTIASDLLQQHFQTLVADNAQWQTLIADDLLWELPFAVALGHPTRLSGRDEVVRHANWFVGAVENFRFFDLRLQVLADPDAAVAEVKAEGVIKATGRLYRQEYVVFLRAVGGKIVYLREYFDPTRAAQAMDSPILGPKSCAVGLV